MNIEWCAWASVSINIILLIWCWRLLGRPKVVDSGQTYNVPEGATMIVPENTTITTLNMYGGSFETPRPPSKEDDKWTKSITTSAAPATSARG